MTYALCRVFLAEVMPFEVPKHLEPMEVIRDASQRIDQVNERQSYHWAIEEQTLESRKRLDNIGEVEQENLKIDH